MTSRFRRYYRRWRFLLLLVTLILLLVIHPLAWEFGVRGPLFEFLYSLTLMAAVLSLFDQRWPRIVAILLGVPALLGRWLAYLIVGSGESLLLLSDHFVDALFLGFVAMIILHAILTHPSMSNDSIFGAICAYLLLGAAWGSVYAAIESIQPGSFYTTGNQALALQSSETRQATLTYYSFVTLTTLGYGDIVPATPSARTLSWLEATVGQFYIAVLVASLVGTRLGRPREAENSRGPS